MMYRDFDTNGLWSREEIEETFNAEPSLYEKYESVDEYIDFLLALGRDKTGGIVEVEDTKWYAVMLDNDDNDWGTGSYDYDEAAGIAEKYRDDYPDTYIAVIDNDICIEEIREL